MAARDHLNPVQFYHGSSQLFEPGDVIEPGHEPQNSMRPRHHVFLSSTQRNARLWGARVGEDDELHGGHVYEVSMPPEYEPDETGNRTTGTKANYKTRHPVTVVRKLR